MPSRGWKKDQQESNLATVMSSQGVSIESLLFPKSTINKLIKHVLQSESPDANPMIMSKDSQVVIQRSCVLFINYIYHTAKQVANTSGRKVVKPEDIIAALKEVEFDGFEPVLWEELDKFKARKKLKKQEREARAVEAIETKPEDDANKRVKTTGEKSAIEDVTIGGESDDNHDEEMPDEEEQGQEEDEESDEEQPGQPGSQIQRELKELAGESDEAESGSDSEDDTKEEDDDEEQ